MRQSSDQEVFQKSYLMENVIKKCIINTNTSLHILTDESGSIGNFN